MSDAYVLVLSAPERGKQIPVIIGETEAQAIVMAIERRQARRPLTHNLLFNIMESFMLTLKKVTIDRFEEGIFYSTLFISDGFTEKHIDSRTTDAIILALMQGCDVMMDLSVLEETSMEPGALEANMSQNKAHLPNPEEAIEQLEEKLRQCEEAEDYEQAAEIMKRINQLKST